MAEIYALGSNGSGQLGISHKEDVSVPKPVIFIGVTPKHVTQIRAGGNHTLLLSSDALFCSGDLSSGACGVKSETASIQSHFQEPKLSTDDHPHKSKVVFCAASWEASFIVVQDESGRATRVYSFGTGNKGELGLGDFLFRSAKAQLIPNFPPIGTEIVDLAASVSHIVAVLSTGEVYGWGNGRKGQLSHPEDIIYFPRKFSGVDFKATRAVCGREFTYLVAERGIGEHVILGSDKWQVKSSAPPNVLGWKDVCASWGTIYVLREDGTLISWGRDDHGQLPPHGLPLLSQIAIGSEHGLSLTIEGDVLAWGWGEHGNCGPNTTKGDVKDRWNVVASSKYLPPGSKITHIGAGCATSWICVTD